MLQLNDILLRAGPRVLLEHASLTIYPSQKIGLVGANGSGKTSLLRAILGELSLDDGEISRAAHCRIAHLAQEIPALPIPALDYVCEGDEEWRHLQQAISKAEKEERFEALGELHAKLQTIDGYTIQARAAELLHGLGFSQEEMQKTVAEFSGGWRMRLNLARVLLSRADLLFLDEPTNHLDMEAILWLEKWLSKCASAVLIISHDRTFLDGVVQHIVHLDQRNLKIYTGDYSTFEQTRAEQLALQQAQHQKQQAKIGHLMNFVNLNRARASKAKQAQSRLKMIERMEKVAAVHADTPFHFTFVAGASKANPLLTVKDGAVAYDEVRVLDHLNLSVMKDARIGVLGPNGAGKTTLLKLLRGQLPLVHGLYETAAKLKIGYFAQHQVDELVLTESPLWHLKQLDPDAREQSLRTFLGTFNFIGDVVFSPITHFSGGEKARLAFALLAWQKPDILLLDEPTNHLDIEMREALTRALQAYEGGILLISHDRYLLSACVDNFWLVAHHRVKDFKGDLDDYRTWFLEEEAKMTRAAKAETSKPISLLKQVETAHKNRKKQQTRLAHIELELEKILLEEQLLLEKLSDNELYLPENQSRLDPLMKKKETLEAEKNKLQEEWLQLSEALG